MYELNFAFCLERKTLVYFRNLAKLRGAMDLSLNFEFFGSLSVAMISYTPVNF